MCVCVRFVGQQRAALLSLTMGIVGFRGEDAFKNPQRKVLKDMW